MSDEGSVHSTATSGQMPSAATLNDPEVARRLKEVERHNLKSGSHRPNEANGHFNACVMEAVAYVAGEPWSDAPQCACPVITAFMVTWNDGLPTDADRNRLLKPLIPHLIGTRSTPEVEQRRSTMATDWLIRTYTPAWLRAAKLDAQAQMLESLPEITDLAQCPSLMPTLKTIRSDAAAALAAARDVAWAAAWHAAGNAAWDVARVVTARDADAAMTAARDAAMAAVRDAINPTVAQLQASAVELVKRMCAVSAARGEQK